MCVGAGSPAAARKKSLPALACSQCCSKTLSTVLNPCIGFPDGQSEEPLPWDTARRGRHGAACLVRHGMMGQPLSARLLS